MQVKDDTTVVACAPKDSNNYRTSLHGLTRSVHKFTFSKIFPESTSQAQLFSGTTFPVVKDFVEGHNCLMFTYGVTNSGKTFTVLGKLHVILFSLVKVVGCRNELSWL
jgi:kinesin family protein 20